MKGRRGRLATWWIMGLGVLVLLACGFAFKDRIAEEWYLHKLESGDVEEQKAAAERLREMGSVRAVPVMFAILRSTARKDLRRSWIVIPIPSSTAPSVESLILLSRYQFLRYSPDSSDTRRLGPVHPDSAHLPEALWKITAATGKASVPHLIDELHNSDASIRYLVATLLGYLGSHARAAVPALIQALNKPPTVNLDYLLDADGNFDLRLASISFSTARMHWGGDIRGQILWALSRIGPEAKEAVPALTELLDDDDEHIRQAAAGALKKIKGDEGTER